MNDNAWDGAQERRLASIIAEQVARTATDAANQVAINAAATAQHLAESTKIDLGYIREQLGEIRARLDTKFVTIEAFDPVRKLVYGLVGLALTGIVLSIMALVLRQPRP